MDFYNLCLLFAANLCDTKSHSNDTAFKEKLEPKCWLLFDFGHVFDLSKSFF